jgi:hypothetical protein
MASKCKALSSNSNTKKKKKNPVGTKAVYRKLIQIP